MPSLNLLQVPSQGKPREKSYFCQYEGCGKAYTRPCRLEEHQRSHTGQRPFVCDWENCDKAFLRAAHLKAHVRSHTQERPYPCRINDCTEAFRTNQHLKRHQGLHFETRPFRCLEYPPCAEAFRKQDQLRNHISNSHTHVKPYHCTSTDCNKSFSTKWKLNNHMVAAHPVVPRYLCLHDNCTLTDGFHSQHELQDHILDSHPPKCIECGKLFASYRRLAKHFPVHESFLDDRRIHKCPMINCPKSFTRPHALKTHIQAVHEKAKPFTCPFENCSRAFGYKKLLDNHIQRSHTIHSVPTQPQSDKNRGTMTLDIVGQLTGVGYESLGKKIQCLYKSCPWRFSRQYDLTRHIDSVHRTDAN
ncbi:Transcription factor IIIA [Neolecta irregularis DAH-3]|uniref:Transcription factor IIIA n=1 Tax=Neolecta irregularis (strain DAH-3) TaxID=1198029 RepID=A0A1U7LH59_NEOID|nr:Transcription factor IIIA [Neolecta irregularis DAH-3]|eukprot:OLL21984.1 Transcription factor IIIA [Neolecta irregularis DAH-3]